MELISKFHIIDIIGVLVFIRIGYVSFLRGIVSEILKCAGLFLASFFSFQYYRVFLGDVFEKGPFAFSRTILDFTSFILIFFGTTFIFFLIRRLVLLLSHRESIATWEKYTSLTLGLLRAMFAMSVIVFALSNFQAASPQIKESVSYKLFKSVAPAAYIKSFRLFKLINPQTELNKEVVNYHETQSVI